MDAFGHNMSRWGFRTHTREVARDEPSPLRIVKRGISAGREGSSRSSSRRTVESAGSGVSYRQQDESINVTKRRRIRHGSSEGMGLSNNNNAHENKCLPSLRDRNVSWNIDHVEGSVQGRDLSPFLPKSPIRKASIPLRVKRIRPQRPKGRSRGDEQET